jgi:Leucine-rich repeat (LRR) protein
MGGCLVQHSSRSNRNIATFAWQLDLRNNVIYLEDDLHNVFLHMPQLQTLLMDDNYIVSTTGLPTQFAKLQSLQKLSLSYNLLQGEFDGSVFEGMSLLSHLELESNYIKGGIPSSLAYLPNMEYLYMRRNSLTFPLEDLIGPGKIPNVFALWLDGNNVTGTIPSTIGDLSSLASFSVTNSSLTGTIPPEMGLLTDMRRCWLFSNQLTGTIPNTLAMWFDIQVFEVYDNELTGTMPNLMCGHVANSTYKYKTLSADCDEISCYCCTACY